MSLSSIKTPNKSLVPVVKGVSDPNKGLIFRTYHVRPEQLVNQLQSAKSAHAHVNTISVPNHSKLSNAIKGQDITHLRHMFSKNSKVWESIHNRQRQGVEKPGHSRQKMLQSVYASVLSQDPVFSKEIKTHSIRSTKVKRTRIEHIEKKNKPLKRNSRKGKIRVKEQYDFMRTNSPLREDDMFVLLPPTPVFARAQQLVPTQQPTPQPVVEQHVSDTGSMLIKRTIEEDVDESRVFAKQLSAFVNLLNPSVQKIEYLYAQLAGDAVSINAIAKNLILRPGVYATNAQLWSSVLSSNLVQHWRVDDNDMEDDTEFYSALMLRQIDNARFNEIFSPYMNDSVQYVLRNKNDVPGMLQSTVLSDVQKQLLVASLTDEQTIENKPHILQYVRTMFEQHDVENAVAMFASYSNHLPAATTYKLFKQTLPVLLTTAYFVENMYKGVDADALGVIMLQMIGSRKLNTHYVPYSEISTLRNVPAFVPVLAVKLFKEYMRHNSKFFNEVLNFTNGQQYTVALPKPDTDSTKDGQLFIRVAPFTVMDVLSETNPPSIQKHACMGVVEDTAVISIHGNKCIVFNAIDTVTFTQNNGAE